MASKVKARVRQVPFGFSVEVQRAKYKHWYLLGRHRATDAAFRKALADGKVEWNDKIMENKLF